MAHDIRYLLRKAKTEKANNGQKPDVKKTARHGFLSIVDKATKNYRPSDPGKDVVIRQAIKTNED